jgi:SPP1 family predicted phage head-tail adaptor
MQAGLLRKRVTLQRRDVAVDSYGGQVTSWTDIATVSAEITPLSGRELFAAQAVQSEVSHRITVRYQPLLANPQTVAAMRAVYNGRFFNIHASVNDEERNRQITLFASEGLNNG